MASNEITELRADVSDLKELLKHASRKRNQDIISIEIAKLETRIVTLAEPEGNVIVPPTSVDPIATTSNASADNKRYQIKLNGYGWDQSDKYVKVFVTLKNVQTVAKEQVSCTLTDRSMELNVRDLDNKDYVLVINKLLYPIDVAASHWKQKTDMVVVFLAKARPNNTWSHMTELDKRFDDAKTSRFKKPEVEEKPGAGDPQDSLMSLMKNMYESGDDDMKRMIAKAWTEGQDKRKTNPVDL